MGLTFIGYNLKEFKYILASLLRHQSQMNLVWGRQAQDISLGPTRQLEHSLPPSRSINSQGTSPEEEWTPKKAAMVTLVCTVCIALMAVIPLPSCLLGAGNFLPMLTAMWQVKMQHFAVSVHRCSFAVAVTAAPVEENWESCESNWKHKGRTHIVFPPTSFPSDTSARQGEANKTLVVAADAASRSPQEAHSNGGLVPSWRREAAAGGLHGQESRRKASGRTDGERRQNE